MAIVDKKDFAVSATEEKLWPKKTEEQNYGQK